MNAALKLFVLIGIIFVSTTNLYARSLVEVSFAWDELNALYKSNITYKINIALEGMTKDKLQVLVPKVKKLYILNLKQSTSQQYDERLTQLYYYIYIKSKYLSENTDSNIQPNNPEKYIDPLYREFSIGQSTEEYKNACTEHTYFNGVEDSTYESCKASVYLTWYFTVEENLHTDDITFTTSSNKTFSFTEWYSINKILNEWKTDINFFMPLGEGETSQALNKVFEVDKSFSKTLEKWTYSIGLPILSDVGNEIELNIVVKWKTIPLSRVKIFDSEAFSIDITSWRTVEQIDGSIDKYHDSFPLNFTVDWSEDIPFYLELQQYWQQEFEWDIVLKKDGVIIKKAILSQNPWYRARDVNKNNIATFTNTQLTDWKYSIEWDIKIHSELNWVSFTLKVWETNY